MGMDRIVAIEDDVGVCRLLRHTLAREDFDLQIVNNGTAGLDLARTLSPDLILLDLGLPDIDGLEVCRRLKSTPETRHIPVIILTGNDKESDVVNGLEIGADDYIVKPVRPRILTARIRAALRRRLNPADTPKTGQDLKIGTLTISAQREVLTLDGEVVDLNPSEFHFIHTLTQVLAPPGDAPSLDFFVGQEGLSLYAEHRLDRLSPIFLALLNGSLQHPLLLKFAGLSLLHTNPNQAETFLNRSATLFAEAGNPVAELSILSHLVLHHLFILGNVEKAAELFKKTEALEHPHFDRLSALSRISVAQALAVGYALFLDNFSRAYEYLSIAEAIAEDRGLGHFRVFNLLIKAYHAYVTADVEKLSRTIHEILLLLNHPQIDTTNKALLKMAQLFYLSLTGDYCYFSAVEETVRDEFGALLPPSSLPLRLLTLLQTESAQANGGHDTVISLHKSDPGPPTVLTSMLALSEALTNRSGAAEKTVQSYLNAKKSIPFFDMQGRLYSIRTLLEIDQSAEAAALLEQTRLQLATSNWRMINIQVLSLSLLFHRGQPLSVQQLTTLQMLITEIKATGIRHLPCLTADDLSSLLYAAIHHDIERLFAADLCRELLGISWNRNWEPVPILHFRTLGGLQLSCQQNPLLSIESFSRRQRDCLALLIAAPNNRIEQEEMQLIFWPDSPPDKARANFDTMLSRLRKTLQAMIAPLSAKNYLKLKNSIVSLDYCSFDIDQLRHAFDRGSKCLSNHDCWQADIAISHGLLLWNGDFIPGSSLADQTAKVADQIHQACTKMTLLWGNRLTELGQTARAIRLLNKAIARDRCNEELIAALHRNYMRSNNLVKADLLLRQYEKSLHAEGYPPADIGRLLTRVRTLTSV